MNGERMTPESVASFLCRFCSDDVTRPSLHSPWISNGKCYATDGCIAIQLDPGLAPLSVERKHQADVPLHCSERIDEWILGDINDVKALRRELLPIDFSLLRCAASCAINDARATAKAEGAPETVFDPDELTLEECVARYSCVILPGKSRLVVSAKYANLICDTVDAFGDCPAFAYLRTGKDKMWKDKYSRILFVGGMYNILLMALRTDVAGWPFQAESVADAATGTLVHRANDTGTSDIDELRFGKGGTDESSEEK